MRKEITNELKDIAKELAEEIETEKEQGEMWSETHEDIVEWMTKPTKFPPRSDYG